MNVAHAYTLTAKSNDGEHQLLLHRPLADLSNKYLSIFQDDGSIYENSDESDEHDLEKRRFNAWAGKRSIMSKRRFNAWAG